MNTFIQNMQNCKTSYKPTYFWSWNDKMEASEIRRQIHEMKNNGIGGFFIHARPGLTTEYMSDEWFKCIGVAIEESEREGIDVWLYDEHGWPSGPNGGSVPARGEYYQEKCISIIETDFSCAANIENLLGIYKIEENHCKLIELNSKDNEGPVIAVYYTVIKDYVDLMSAEVVSAFIEDSYETYRKYYGCKFGKTIKGIFTDEPQYNSYEFPWSFDIPKEYYDRYGKNIIELLPALKYDFDGAEEFRYQFYSLVNSMFTNNYFKQIGEWCKNNNLIFTGHNVAEDSLFDSMLNNAGVMPSYEYLDMPGTDWIGRTIREPTTPKQCSSVAKQLGKPRVLTEQFASSNWDVNLEELKWIADWNYVNGVNFFCQHLAAYSLRGLRKRDCPASLFTHNVWWEKYHLFSDYLSRVSTILSGCEDCCDVAILHPIKSAYICYKRINDGEILQLDTEFLATMEYLSGIHVQYHLADEEIIRKYGSVNGKTFNIGNSNYKIIILPRLHTIERNTYNLLLEFTKNGGQIISFGRLPDRIDGELCDTSTLTKHCIDCSKIPAYSALLKIIEEKNGDGIVSPTSIGQRNDHTLITNDICTAEYSDFWQKTAQGILPRTSLDMPAARYINIDLETKAFINLLRDVDAVQVDITEENSQINNIHCFMSIHDDSRVMFFTNASRVCRYNAKISFKSDGIFSGYDPYNNVLFNLGGFNNEGIFEFNYTFEPMMSLLILENREIIPNKKTDCAGIMLQLGKNYTVSDYNYNALNIDTCSYRVEPDEKWSAPIPVWDVQYLLLRDKIDADIQIRFQFEISDDFKFGKTLEVGAEDTELCSSIVFNGSEIRERFSSFKIDRAIKVADISDIAVHGSNELTISKHYTYSESSHYALFGENVHSVVKNKLCLKSETDSVYIFGKFAVYSKSSFKDTDRHGSSNSGPFYITNENLSLNGLDIIKQGYLFYNQAISVSQELNIQPVLGEKYYFRFDNLLCSCAEIKINGNQVNTIISKPYKFDVTDFLINGENTVELIIYTSNRNLFGPHHFKLGQLHWTPWHKLIDPNEWLFCDKEKSWYTDDYCFYRYGIEE